MSKARMGSVHRIVKTSALVVLLPLSSVLVASEWPEIQAPPHSHAQIVASDMKYNGVPMRIRQFTTDSSMESVLAFYTAQWTEEGKNKPVRNRLGAWQVIGRQVGDFYQTVQVKPRDGYGTEGLIGVSRLPSQTETPHVDELFPRMPNSSVVSDVDSNDSGIAAKTLILENRHSVSSNTSYYQSNMPAAGWQQNKGVGAEPASNGSQILYFERQKQAATIAINPSPDGGTMVVINILSRSL